MQKSWFIYFTDSGINGSDNDSTADSSVEKCTWYRHWARIFTSGKFAILEDDTSEEDLETDDEKGNKGNENRSLYYKGQDEWRKTVPPQHVRAWQENIIMHLAGVIVQVQ